MTPQGSELPAKHRQEPSKSLTSHLDTVTWAGTQDHCHLLIARQGSGHSGLLERRAESNGQNFQLQPGLFSVSQETTCIFSHSQFYLALAPLSKDGLIHHSPQSHPLLKARLQIQPPISFFLLFSKRNRWSHPLQIPDTSPLPSLPPSPATSVSSNPTLTGLLPSTGGPPYHPLTQVSCHCQNTHSISQGGSWPPGSCCSVPVKHTQGLKSDVCLCCWPSIRGGQNSVFKSHHFPSLTGPFQHQHFAFVFVTVVFLKIF